MIRLISAFVILIGLQSCVEEQAETRTQAPPPKKELMKPFRFHKAIEVRPGLTLDVVSWGRGSESTGGYLILRSDSTHLDYRSISGELDGRIKDVWDMDMDTDGNPELYIQAVGEGEGSHLNMYVYEFSDNGSYQKLRFPDLSSRTKEIYRGQDSVFVKDGKLIRYFPVFSGNDSTTRGTGETKKLQYSLIRNSFDVDEIE